MSRWKVSVSELIRIFQGALLALVPWLTKAKIPIKSHDSYDDYDEIVSVLFRRIVMGSVDGALSGFLDLAVYGMHLETYKSCSFLLAKFQGSDNEMMSFVEFQFDLKQNVVARIAILNDDLSVREFQTRECGEMWFELARNRKGEISILHEVEVEL